MDVERLLVVIQYFAYSHFLFQSSTLVPSTSRPFSVIQLLTDADILLLPFTNRNHPNTHSLFAQITLSHHTLFSMQLRVEKRKPDVLDPTRDFGSTQVSKPKITKSTKKLPIQASPSAVSEFTMDTFTENKFNEETKCSLCQGDREMVLTHNYSI